MGRDGNRAPGRTRIPLSIHPRCYFRQRQRSPKADGPNRRLEERRGDHADDDGSWGRSDRGRVRRAERSAPLDRRFPSDPPHPTGDRVGVRRHRGLRRPGDRLVRGAVHRSAPGVLREFPLRLPEVGGESRCVPLPSHRRLPALLLGVVSQLPGRRTRADRTSQPVGGVLPLLPRDSRRHRRDRAHCRSRPLLDRHVGGGTGARDAPRLDVRGRRRGDPLPRQVPGLLLSPHDVPAVGCDGGRRAGLAWGATRGARVDAPALRWATARPVRAVLVASSVRAAGTTRRGQPVAPSALRGTASHVGQPSAPTGAELSSRGRFGHSTGAIGPWPAGTRPRSRLRGDTARSTTGSHRWPGAIADARTSAPSTLLPAASASFDLPAATSTGCTPAAGRTATATGRVAGADTHHTAAAANGCVGADAHDTPAAPSTGCTPGARRTATSTGRTAAATSTGRTAAAPSTGCTPAARRTATSAARFTPRNTVSLSAPNRTDGAHDPSNFRQSAARCGSARRRPARLRSTRNRLSTGCDAGTPAAVRTAATSSPWGEHVLHGRGGSDPPARTRVGSNTDSRLGTIVAADPFRSGEAARGRPLRAGWPPLHFGVHASGGPRDHRRQCDCRRDRDGFRVCRPATTSAVVRCPGHDVSHPGRSCGAGPMLRVERRPFRVRAPELLEHAVRDPLSEQRFRRPRSSAERGRSVLLDAHPPLTGGVRPFVLRHRCQQFEHRVRAEPGDYEHESARVGAPDSNSRRRPCRPPVTPEVPRRARRDRGRSTRPEPLA